MSMDSNALALRGGEEIVHMRAAPLEFSDEQRQMIRDTYANGATDAEFAVLMEVAKARRLNPLLRQIHFVSRWDNKKGRNVWSCQVSIDGLRAIAQRTGLYHGQDEPVYQERDGKLECAKVAVWRRDWPRPAVGVAYWSEYVQTDRDGRPTQFWSRMPHVMLAKVAEALAMRKAFPEDTSGLYVHEEMAQADRPDAGQERDPYSPHPAATNSAADEAHERLSRAKLDTALALPALARVYLDAIAGLTPDDAPIAEAAYKTIVNRAKTLRVGTAAEVRAAISKAREPAPQELAAATTPASEALALTEAQETVRRQYIEAVDVEPLTLDGLLAAWRRYKGELATFPKAEKEGAWCYLVHAATTLTPALDEKGLRAALTPPKGDGPKGGGRKPRAVPSTASAQATASPVASNDGPQSRIVIDDPQTMACAYLADFARGVDLHSWSTHIDGKRHWHAMLSSLVKRAAIFDAEGLLPDRTRAVVDAVARSLRTTPELARAEMRRRVGEKNSSAVQALLLPVLGGYVARRAA